MCAPPSGSSSRSTLVKTQWRRLIFFTDWATRSGSSSSSAAGRPVFLLQKRHERVQGSPISRKVAVPRPQHSPRLGQRASSQTVCRVCERIRRLTFQYSSFWFILTRSQSGRRPRVSPASGSGWGFGFSVSGIGSIITFDCMLVLVKYVSPVSYTHLRAHETRHDL